MDAIYARQSVDKKDSISIETQIELCQREIPSDHRYKVYQDKGYSGSNINRPAFQELLSDIRSGKIERVITYRLDRISRSVLDFANLVDLFERNNVSFNSTQEKFDTSTPMGKAMLSITMVFAQLERETIQRRITDNYYARGEKGMYLGGPAPYGFEKEHIKTDTGTLKLLKQNPETAAVVLSMYEQYGNGLKSLGAISRTLNEKKVPSPNGSNWDSSKVTRVLRNPVSVKADAEVYSYYRSRGCKFANEPADYIGIHGCYLYGKRKGNERKYTDVTDHTLSLAPHDGIVSSDLFLRCQRRLDSNVKIDNRKRSQITWLTGLIKCANCGHGVVPKSSNNGGYRYLYCTGKTAYNCCDVEGNLGALNTVEAIVEERIFRWAKKYSDLKANVEISECKERNRIRCAMEEINVKISRLIDMAMETSSVTSKYLDEKISELEAQRIVLEDELERLHSTDRESVAKEICDIELSWSNLEIAQKSRIAGLLISQINIAKDHIEIVWNYDFNLDNDYSN